MIFRWRTRALLIVNIAMAFAGVMGWRAHKFQAEAARYAGHEEHFREVADWMAEEAETAKRCGFENLERNWRKDADRERRLADYFRDMRVRYQRASRYPWFSIGSDPPRPRYSESEDRDAGR